MPTLTLRSHTFCAAGRNEKDDWNHLKKSIEYDPKNAWLRIGLANHLHEEIFWHGNENPLAAEGCREAAIQTIEEGIDNGALPRFVLWSRLGSLLKEAGRLADSRNAFAESIQQSPDSDIDIAGYLPFVTAGIHWYPAPEYALFELGTIHILLHDFDSAEQQYRLLLARGSHRATELKSLIVEWVPIEKEWNEGVYPISSALRNSSGPMILTPIPESRLTPPSTARDLHRAICPDSHAPRHD